MPRIEIGTLRVPATIVVPLSQEFAAWYENVEVAAGEYKLVAWVDRNPEGYRISQVWGEAIGTTVSAYYGDRAASRVGNRTPAPVRVSTYWRGDASKLDPNVTLCPQVAIETWTTESGDVMSHLVLAPGAAPVTVETCNYGGGPRLAVWRGIMGRAAQIVLAGTTLARARAVGHWGRCEIGYDARNVASLITHQDILDAYLAAMPAWCRGEMPPQYR